MANICLLILIATQMYCSLSLGQNIPVEIDNGVQSQGKLARVPRGLSLVKRLATKSALTEDEKLVFLAKHNELRGQTIPQAANMEYMEWDDTLATHAQRYTDMCVWAHGFPDENITPFDPVGQNLWYVGPVAESDRPNPAAIVQSFFNEREHYDYASNTCDDDYDCGHYTQVVWHSSYKLGCGVTFCATASGTAETDIMLVSCHYGEAGNYAGAKPYTSGTPCTKCSSGSGQCYENNCRRCSADPNDPSCVCAQVCQNCGTLDGDTCECKCFWGYNLADCSARCIDDQRCGNEFPYSHCKTDKSVRRKCPAMCGDCFEYLPDFFTCAEDTLDK